MPVPDVQVLPHDVVQLWGGVQALGFGFRVYGCTVWSTLRGEIGVGRQHVPIPDVVVLPQDSGFMARGIGLSGLGEGLGVYGNTVWSMFFGERLG